MQISIVIPEKIHSLQAPLIRYAICMNIEFSQLWFNFITEIGILFTDTQFAQKRSLVFINNYNKQKIPEYQ